MMIALFFLSLLCVGAPHKEGLKVQKCDVLSFDQSHKEKEG